MSRGQHLSYCCYFSNGDAKYFKIFLQWLNNYCIFNFLLLIFLGLILNVENVVIFFIFCIRLFHNVIEMVHCLHLFLSSAATLADAQLFHPAVIFLALWFCAMLFLIGLLSIFLLLPYSNTGRINAKHILINDHLFILYIYYVYCVACSIFGMVFVDYWYNVRPSPIWLKGKSYTCKWQ